MPSQGKREQLFRHHGPKEIVEEGYFVANIGTWLNWYCTLYTFFELFDVIILFRSYLSLMLVLWCVVLNLFWMRWKHANTWYESRTPATWCEERSVEYYETEEWNSSHEAITFEDKLDILERVNDTFKGETRLE